MNADEQEIRALVSRWLEATRAGEVDTVLDLMTDDAVFLVAGQPPMDKSIFAAAARAQAGANAPSVEGKSDIREIRIMGEWAYLWTWLSVSITFQDGRPAMARAGHGLSILRKENGRWRVARDANLLMPVDLAKVRPS
jgi:uncharacterized protein (TIGR02246 family)